MASFRLSERARKFLREVGSIVLGVLIALAIGEIADDLRWQSRAAHSTRAINIELARAAGVLDERAWIQSCLTERLDQLDEAVRTARRTGTLADIGPIGRTPIRPLQTSAWDDAVNSGVLSHIDMNRRSMLSLNYPLLKSFPSSMAEESLSWARLRILEGVPGRASDQLLIEAAGTIAQLQWGSKIIGLTAKQTLDDLVAAGIKPSYFLILDHEGTRAEMLALHRENRMCRSLEISETNVR